MLFREALANAGMKAIEEWWAHLDASSRSEALQLWHDCSQRESGVTVRVEAEFTDDQDEVTDDFWHSDYYDYLVNHEIYLFSVAGVHICTQQPEAAAAVRAGIIPHGFTCPLQTANCPMRRVLALSPGKSLRLRVSVVATDRMSDHAVLKIRIGNQVHGGKCHTS